MSAPAEHPLLVVLGPTASGKSELAIELAVRFRGEVVNFDSVQLYRSFDIGSAKTPLEERRGVPHHLLDIVDPNETFSSGEYARVARNALGEISGRDRLPVMVGGSGFYLRAALEGLFEGPQRDEALRRRLDGLFERGRLHRLLRRLDPDAAGKIHPNDRPKLVRAVEVCLLERRPLTEAHAAETPALEGFHALRLGLNPSRERLYERIERRSRAMFEAGLLKEVSGLLAAGAPETAWPFGSLGYRQALDCLAGRLSLDEAIEETARATRRYAKRQLTWFRNQEPETVWLEGFGPEVADEAARLVSDWLSKGRS